VLISQLGLGKALEAALAIPNQEYRIKVLDSLAPRLSNWVQIQPHIAYVKWQKAVHCLSAYPRPHFLADLRALMPFTLALAGEEVEAVAEGIFRAIEDVCKWWR